MASPQTEEPDPFAGFGAGELFGFVHHKLGEEGLRELLAMLANSSTTREFLQDASDELDAAGLSRPAAIVAKFAAKAPSELDVGCPYPDGSKEAKIWRHKWLQKQELASGEMLDRLRRNHNQNTRKA